MTPQRQRVLDAVATLGHATPEEVVDRVVADGGATLAPSTVYRALDALESLGVVGHTHLDHRAPSYHLADHADHIHLGFEPLGGSRTGRQLAAVLRPHQWIKLIDRLGEIDNPTVRATPSRDAITVVPPRRRASDRHRGE